jgi:MurNAc alpha-1-phosphate uridylyltransferase
MSSNHTAMILAAGKGNRMLPLTKTIPKPLIKVKDKSLIDYIIENLISANFSKIVINTSHLKESMLDHFKYSEFKKEIKIEIVSENQPLETAGGVRNAIERIQSETFALINGDIFTTFNFLSFKSVFKEFKMSHDLKSFIYLVKNPPHNLNGDFDLQKKLVCVNKINPYTYSGIGIYRKKFFFELDDQEEKLGNLLKSHIHHGTLIKGSIINDIWDDVGTIERLNNLRKKLT